MPLVTYQCPKCERVWDTIEGPTVSFDDSVCRCGEKGEKQIAAQAQRVYTTDWETEFKSKPKEEQQMILKNKRILESRSEEILDGRLGISENGPQALRPQCPEHLRKRYY